MTEIDFSDCKKCPIRKECKECEIKDLTCQELYNVLAVGKENEDGHTYQEHGTD